MNKWLRKTAEKKYKVDVDGRTLALTEEVIGKLIKQKLLKVRGVVNLLEAFEIEPSHIKSMKISILPLENEYAETDAEEMKLNETLFSEGRFFEDYFFIVCHEIIHWMSRVREAEAYFNDPEEVLGFVSSIAYEMGEGSSRDEIWNKIYNKVSWHFSNEHDAREFFMNMYEKAQKLLQGTTNP